ncbi:hypothetical protein QWZ03_15350 [Chitinimonas viridis]|uniref:Lipoprotein n=1 Tax=Chitinimonas viridis TaxID=664880 RepID=A0ABT8B8M3_9NEIS|nr:hypothetical protein [Chitinimonas viridis]MDN3578142.1 hypothetical protein [Chitinimonas viridis]
MKRLFVLAAALLLTACATQTPVYQPSIANVQKLNALQPLKVGEFRVADPKLDSIGLRGSSMRSSVGSNYGDYIKQALGQDLALAKKLEPAASTEISGELLAHDIDISGFSTGNGKIKVQFVVKKNAQEAFRKQISAESQWESSFVGAVAIPRGIENYALLLQRLFANLYDDADFIAATK